MKRFGQVAKVRSEKEAYYRKLHANPWPGVLKTIKDCNIQNYSIFIRDGYAFAYYEYVGNDYEADMAKMAADPVTQKWWDECVPCLSPVDSAPEGTLHWVDMEDVFYYE